MLAQETLITADAEEAAGRDEAAGGGGLVLTPEPHRGSHQQRSPRRALTSSSRRHLYGSAGCHVLPLALDSMFGRIRPRTCVSEGVVTQLVTWLPMSLSELRSLSRRLRPIQLLMRLSVFLDPLLALLSLAVHEHARQRDNIHTHDGTPSPWVAEKNRDRAQDHHDNRDCKAQPKPPPGTLAAPEDGFLLQFVPMLLLTLCHGDDAVCGTWKHFLVATQKIGRRVRTGPIGFRCERSSETEKLSPRAWIVQSFQKRSRQVLRDPRWNTVLRRGFAVRGCALSLHVGRLSMPGLFARDYANADAFLC